MIDGHAHVFHRGLKLAEARRYAPDYDATLERYLAMLDRHGFRGGVLVQPSFLGFDNAFLLQSLARAPRLRGIAVVDPALSKDALAALIDQGVVGLRANLVGAATPDFLAEPWRTFLRHAAALDLPLEVQADAARLSETVPLLLETDGLVVVIDHFGLPDPSRGADDPALGTLMTIASRSDKRCWMKLSALYRLGPAGTDVARLLVPRLRDAFGLDRLVFGSDWPHTRFEDKSHVAGALAALAAWFPDAAERHVVTDRNAADLFKMAADET